MAPALPPRHALALMVPMKSLLFPTPRSALIGLDLVTGPVLSVTLARLASRAPPATSLFAADATTASVSLLTPASVTSLVTISILLTVPALPALTDGLDSCAKPLFARLRVLMVPALPPIPALVSPSSPALLAVSALLASPVLLAQPLFARADVVMELALPLVSANAMTITLLVLAALLVPLVSLVPAV